MGEEACSCFYCWNVNNSHFKSLFSLTQHRFNIFFLWVSAGPWGYVQCRQDSFLSFLGWPGQQLLVEAGAQGGRENSQGHRIPNTLPSRLFLVSKEPGHPNACTWRLCQSLSVQWLLCAVRAWLCKVVRQTWKLWTDLPALEARLIKENNSFDPFDLFTLSERQKELGLVF